MSEQELCSAPVEQTPPPAPPAPPAETEAPAEP